MQHICCAFYRLEERGHYGYGSGASMRLIAVEPFLDKYFAEDSRPSERTLRRWLRTDKLPARKVGGTWYVDEDLWLADGDPLVERVLSGR